ncbi:MAG: Sapep family Mn(2+)-dependent dipeptidase [Firmicutes bacterium]|nr:Sapep family Mn(2+)-dependent dipeptidase [Bacillota bacterium]
MNRRMTGFLDKHFDRMLEDLAELIAVPSESDDHEKVAECLELALRQAERYGFRAYTAADGKVGIVEMGEGPETLGILTHVDVVPAGDPARWDSDPYKAEIRDGKIYGRGTLDDKGLVVSSLFAMMAVREQGLPLHKKVQLIIGTQEEVEWTDMDEYVSKYPLPDYGFTPDGSYPICNIEKGYIDQTMEFDVSEDDTEGLYLKELDIGVAVNVVPGEAAAVLSDGRVIKVTGKACHSSQPENGVNAMMLLGKELKGLGLKENKLLRLLYAIGDDFSDNYGEKLGLRSESDYYQGEFVHRNVLTPTILKAKDGRAELAVNVRFPYGEESKRIIGRLTSWAEEHGGKVISVDSQEAVFVPKASPFLKVFADAYEEVSGLKNEFTLEYGGTYAKAMPNIVSWGPIFPGEEDMCHQANEYIGAESLLVSTKIFAEAIAGIVLSEKSFK